jgi:cysteine-rich repeat protein
MRSIRNRAGLGALVGTLALIAIAGGTVVAEAASFSSKTLAVCQKAANKAAQKLLSAKLSAATRCAEGLLGCQLAEELDGGDFSTCASGVSAKCSSALGKVTSARAALGSLLAGKCAALTDANLGSTRGVGYSVIADACADLSPVGSSHGLAAITDCLDRSLLCRGDDIVESLIPRAYEILDRAGVLASSSDLFPCLDVRVASSASGSETKSLLSCQNAIHKGGQKKLKAQQKGVYACADAFLRCQLQVDRLESSLAEGVECIAAASPKCDAKLSKLASAAAKRDDGVTSACGSIAIGDVLAGLGFVATCPAAESVSDVGVCADVESDVAVEQAIGVVEPRTCSLLKGAARIAGFEEVCLPFCGNGEVEAGETCDDGNADAVDGCTNTCTSGPTAFEILTVPSAVAPANTPDGTPATAVAPGSTLATQFASTEFSLNNVTYTRFHVPGAGDPDAVLILVPGFAGGSHSFKYLAENLLVRAQAGGAMTLEVWAYDRRTNQLEDRAGAALAESERDPLLAFNWYFGDETGLPSDPRLSRRAVFHAGEDVAFIANWTPNVFARDIDTLVDAAAALPGAPKVFLGGHSLGTTFVARYASTDFDPGVGVEPGYAKLAGLVLFEGGGSALPSVVPNSDSLDLIIAKADGGLFHAVKNGDARCVDGTACPGGDADCAGVPLPVGAVTNKCVQAVEAYTGADTSAPLVLVTPQVHAAGDVAAIQARVDPDGQSMIQVDFGAGKATDVVGGLGILGALPPSTTAAAVGFFLDDDFSPVSAFQASLGFSSNGGNTKPFGFFLPGAPYAPDVLRTWDNIDQPMVPAGANGPVPDNGPATSPNDTNGQEKEVTDVRVMTTLLFSGGINFGDSYFASSGLSVTTADGVCTAGTCSAGNVGVACTTNAQCSVSLGLDSSPLSVGRGRPDIENLTQATAIDVPVIAFGGTNGLTPTNGSFKAFAESIGDCTAPSCDGVTPRVVNPLTINTEYGGINGGFEAHLSEGYAHIDVLSAEDDPSHNHVYDPLMAFLERNLP